jgi:hypothetical protein
LSEFDEYLDHQRSRMLAAVQSLLALLALFGGVWVLAFTLGETAFIIALAIAGAFCAWSLRQGRVTNCALRRLCWWAAALGLVLVPTGLILQWALS